MDSTLFKLLYRHARCRAKYRDKYGDPLSTACGGFHFWFASRERGFRGARVDRGDCLGAIRVFPVLGTNYGGHSVELRRAFLVQSRKQPPVPLP